MASFYSSDCKNLNGNRVAHVSLDCLSLHVFSFTFRSGDIFQILEFTQQQPRKEGFFGVVLCPTGNEIGANMGEKRCGMFILLVHD